MKEATKDETTKKPEPMKFICYDGDYPEISVWDEETKAGYWFERGTPRQGPAHLAKLLMKKKDFTEVKRPAENAQSSKTNGKNTNTATQSTNAGTASDASTSSQ